MVKKNFKQDVYQCLTENVLGLTVTDISNKLSCSRNTVYKYLEKLEAQELIYKKKVGIYTIYYSKGKGKLNREGIISFFKELLANLKKTFPNKENIFMEFGRKIADNMTIPFSSEKRDFLETFKNHSDESILESIGKFSPLFNILRDDIEISKIEIDNKQKNGIITFVNSNMLETSDDYIYYFFLIAGLVERKLSSYTRKNIKFDIIDYDIFDEKEKSYIKFSIEFEISLPQIETDEIEEIIIPDADIIDVDLIKDNLNALTLSFIIRGILLKEKVLILIEKEFLRNHLLNFLKFISQNSFEIDISIEKNEVFQKNKEYFKDHIVIGKNKVFNDNNNILTAKKNKVESILIQRFLIEYDTKTSLIGLKKEIQKAFILSKELAEEVSELTQNEEREKIDSKKLLQNIEKTYNTKISLAYLNFLIEIVEKYYEISIPKNVEVFPISLINPEK